MQTRQEFLSLSLSLLSLYPLRLLSISLSLSGHVFVCVWPCASLTICCYAASHVVCRVHYTFPFFLIFCIALSLVLPVSVSVLLSMSLFLRLSSSCCLLRYLLVCSPACLSVCLSGCLSRGNATSIAGWSSLPHVLFRIAYCLPEDHVALHVVHSCIYS